MTLTAKLDSRDWVGGKATIRLNIQTRVSPMGEVVSTESGIAFYDNAEDGPEMIDVLCIPPGAVLFVQDGDVIGNGAVIACW